MLAYSYPLLNLFWSMLMIFGLVLWFWLLFTVFVDIFRSPDLGGWGKAGWFVFVLVLPLIGVLVYLIARGHKMAEHAAQRAQAADEEFNRYVRNVAGDGSSTEELAKLAELRDRGVVTTEEFERQKAKILG